MWEIARHLKAGVAEDQAREYAADVLQSMGLRKGWHKILVRCGPNTAKNFGEASSPGVILGEDDVFFVDIGPVFEGIEGDAGRLTFVVGDDSDMVRAPAIFKGLWRVVRDHWRDEGSSGADLYGFARKDGCVDGVAAQSAIDRSPPG